MFLINVNLIKNSNYNADDNRGDKLTVIWRPLILSELTPYCMSWGLTHLASEASI